MWQAFGKIISSIAGKGGGGGGGNLLGGIKSELERPVSTSIGGLMGIGQMIAGAVKKRKARHHFPTMYDAGERRMENELQAQDRDLMAGTGAAASAANRMLARTIGGRTAGISRSGMGTGAQLFAMTKGAADDSGIIADSVANIVANRQNLNQLRSAIAANQSKRKLQLGLAKYSELQAAGSANLKAGLSNLVGSLVGDTNNKSSAGAGSGGVDLSALSSLMGSQGSVQSTAPVTQQKTESTPFQKRALSKISTPELSFTK